MCLYIKVCICVYEIDLWINLPVLLRFSSLSQPGQGCARYPSNQSEQLHRRYVHCPGVEGCSRLCSQVGGLVDWVITLHRPSTGRCAICVIKPRKYFSLTEQHLVWYTNYSLWRNFKFSVATCNHLTKNIVLSDDLCNMWSFFKYNLVLLFAIQNTVLNNYEEHITLSRSTYIFCAQTLPLQFCFGRPFCSRPPREVLVPCRCELVGSGLRFDKRYFLLCGQVEKSSLSFGREGRV